MIPSIVGRPLKTLSMIAQVSPAEAVAMWVTTNAFTARPLNSAPVDAIPVSIDLLTRTTPAAPWAKLSSSLALGQTDEVPQWTLDAILWKSVYGVNSTPPPPGPNADSHQ